MTKRTTEEQKRKAQVEIGYQADMIILSCALNGCVLREVRDHGHLDDRSLSEMGIGHIEAEHYIRLAERLEEEIRSGKRLDTVLRAMRRDGTLDTLGHFTISRLEKPS
jgi:hypothetical protein